jgi:2-hydroxychromene-2-carboxylate isomerase
MRVDVWADIVCPWCYLGSARFAAALSQFEHRDDVEVVYHSFELDPGAPATDTQPVLDMLAAKYGMSPAQAAEAEGRVQGLAQAAGLDFTVHREYGNTRAAHRLLQYAQARGHGPDMMTALYRAYFGAGRPVFDPASLAAVAAGAGLDAGQARLRRPTRRLTSRSTTMRGRPAGWASAGSRSTSSAGRGPSPVPSRPRCSWPRSGPPGTTPPRRTPLPPRVAAHPLKAALAP